MRPVRLLLAAVATLWLVLLLAAPSAALGVPASGATYLFGSFICHQRADRSFHLAAAQLPVCARCFGLYMGATVVLCFAALKRCATSSLAARWRSPSGLRAAMLVAALPTAITWGAEVLGLWNPGNAVRFAAALPLGAAAALTVNYVGCARTRPSGRERPPTPI